jgi:hypothetical protein
LSSVQLAARGDDDEADVGADRRQHGRCQAASDGSAGRAAIRRSVRRSAAARSGERLYAPRDRVDELSDAVLARCEREVVGDGLASDVTLGPLYTAAGRDRVEGLVKDAAAQGATVRRAGRIREADADAGGYFVLPTVVTGLAQDSALASEEQFGPVLPIFGYDAIDDAVAAANDTEFGLSVNCHGMAAQDPRAPTGSGRSPSLGVTSAKLRRNSTICTACRLWQYGFHQHHVVCRPQRQVVIQLFTRRPRMQERPVDAAGELH